VTAAAGTGKSRLIGELVRAAAERHPGLEVLVARGDSLGAGSPLAMAGQVIRRAAGIQDGDLAPVKAAKLATRVARIGADGAAVTGELLREIAGLPVPAAEASEALRAARQDATAMGDAVRAAWEAWLDAECAAGPRAIVLEDLHWGDSPTVQLVDGALRNLAERPLFVVATARPEVHDVFPKLWAERAVDEVRLGPVSKSASERLVREILGAAVDARRLAMVILRAAGNPFLLEELIRAVAEGRAEHTLPEGVLGMVQLRLDALAPDARRALRAASVFGETFWRGGVAALLGGEDPGLARALAELAAKELTAPRPGTRVPGDEEHAFRHALVRDAAYAMLPDADRAAAHALAGAWLEEVGSHDPLVLAEHYDRGGVALRAIAWYQRAAEQALEGGDPEGALRRAERALACGAEGEVRGALEHVCAEALYWRGELAPSRARAEAAASLLPEGIPGWFRAVATLINAASLSPA
jgi:predicted ATPase